MELRAWWHAMRPRCAPFGAPRPRPQVQLAVELDAYFELLGERSWFGHRVATDFILLSAGAIAELLTDDDVFAAAAGWLPFASRGDRVGWFLSATGQVAETYEDSPWLAGPDTSAVTPFAAWRTHVLGFHRHEPDTATAIALAGDEHAALERALDADPYEVLVYARDLQYHVTPDPAWRHAAGAPDRVAHLDDWTSLSPNIATELYRGEDTTIALFNAAALADRPYVRDNTLGTWDTHKRFTRHADARSRLRELCATAANLAGLILVVADTNQP